MLSGCGASQVVKDTGAGLDQLNPATQLQQDLSIKDKAMQDINNATNQENQSANQGGGDGLRGEWPR